MICWFGFLLSEWCLAGGIGENVSWFTSVGWFTLSSSALQGQLSSWFRSVFGWENLGTPWLSSWRGLCPASSVFWGLCAREDEYGRAYSSWDPGPLSSYVAVECVKITNELNIYIQNLCRLTMVWQMGGKRCFSGKSVCEKSPNDVLYFSLLWKWLFIRL